LPQGSLLRQPEAFVQDLQLSFIITTLVKDSLKYKFRTILSLVARFTEALCRQVTGPLGIPDRVCGGTSGMVSSFSAKTRRALRQKPMPIGLSCHIESLGLEPKLIKKTRMRIELYPVPGVDRVVLFRSESVERLLIVGLGSAQLPKNCQNEGFKSLNMLFRLSRGVLRSILGLPKARNSLHANTLEPSGSHEGKRNFPGARLNQRILLSSKESQMPVPVGMVTRDIAPEFPHQGAVISLHLPVGLRVVRRCIVRDNT